MSSPTRSHMVPGLVSRCALHLRAAGWTELRGEEAGGLRLVVAGRRQRPVKRQLRERHRRPDCFYQSERRYWRQHPHGTQGAEARALDAGGDGARCAPFDRFGEWASSKVSASLCSSRIRALASATCSMSESGEPLQGDPCPRIVVPYGGPQQSSVHIDVGGNQLVGAEVQNRAINERRLGVAQHFVFKSCRGCEGTDLALELCLKHLFLVVELVLVQTASALQPPQLHLQGQLLLGRTAQI
ncbi:hypothetical protein EYF80_037907 [Liparis tanakae]|uniref:Uncharacterized protein n=1 Tax=Liparis tanakae TaxID=230148 RepID=A0A4Z2GF69_9TELE|nr:hypothetical protein EYF80_037907 [Liparis tanakae]